MEPGRGQGPLRKVIPFSLVVVHLRSTKVALGVDQWCFPPSHSHFCQKVLYHLMYIFRIYTGTGVRVKHNVCSYNLYLSG